MVSLGKIFRERATETGRENVCLPASASPCKCTCADVALLCPNQNLVNNPRFSDGCQEIMALHERRRKALFFPAYKAIFQALPQVLAVAVWAVANAHLVIWRPEVLAQQWRTHAARVKRFGSREINYDAKFSL